MTPKADEKAYMAADGEARVQKCRRDSRSISCSYYFQEEIYSQYSTKEDQR